MEITDVRVRLVDDAKLRAVAAVTFDNLFVVRDIKVVARSSDTDLFMAMPSRKMPDGEYQDIAHAINPAFRAKLQIAVMDKYHAALGMEGD